MELIGRSRIFKKKWETDSVIVQTDRNFKLLFGDVFFHDNCKNLSR